MSLKTIAQTIAQELNAQDHQVNTAIELLDGGSTVPFIARYRKEATGGLDDIQLRALEERLRYLREMAERCAAILKSIDEQGKLSDELRAKIVGADTKARLEDLYLPFKPKRRTKAQMAREAGLEPLALALKSDPTLDPKTTAQTYVNADAEHPVADVDAALEGAKQILVEGFGEDAELVGRLRDEMWGEAKLSSRVIDGKQTEGAKFTDYFEYDEPLKKVPSHRALAIFRGRKEEVLRAALCVGDPANPPYPHPYEGHVALHFGIEDQGRAADAWLMECARWAWRVKISLRIELDLMQRLWTEAEEEAIRVFAENLRALLLAAPAGQRATIGLDPGFRSGVKVAVLDNTGKLVDTAVIYPHEPQKRWDESIACVAALAQEHDAELVAIGNGTASRETDKLAAELLSRYPQLKLKKIMVSEAGASVYSASAYASQEFPDIDVSLRGAASIGRRLQDPLAELVKIEPKAIGVGQYQHDVSEHRMGRSLNAVVEDCVNAVGVDLNTASQPLLAQVSGLSARLAENVVAYRDANGAFQNRKGLMKVSGLGAKAFEQCAGFLRIKGGDNPLDASSVHPESYPVIKRILASSKVDLSDLLGNATVLRGLQASAYADEKFGVQTIKDILLELEKPGRDPRPEFKTAEFKDGVEKMSDLTPGLRLEGVVTNVANFGAFVDVGVHQDGLVHISQLADKFVEDPRDIVKPGDVVLVRVIEVDVARKRISLTMKSGDVDASSTTKRGVPSKGNAPRNVPRNKPRQMQSKSTGDTSDNAFAAAFAKAKNKGK
ncbi:MAG: RNA-binding transcriptional accessory protein [Magnetovibrio sp.]|nr:RNA-binding transcriptional accessory protein [Magnetovibrio sp.]